MEKRRGQHAEIRAEFLSNWQWQIYPTAEHYAQIPTIMRPTPLQLFVPHAAFIDYLIWCVLSFSIAILPPSLHVPPLTDSRPSVRDFFILNDPLPALRDTWTSLVSSTVHLSDPPADGIDMYSRLQLSDEEASTRLKPSFKEYIDCADRWVVGDCVVEEIPGLEGQIRCDGTRAEKTGEFKEAAGEGG